MKYKEIVIREEYPEETFDCCGNCIHSEDSEEICILRKCVHAIRQLNDCYKRVVKE